MNELAAHDSLQSALHEAFARHRDAVCVIEADRDRENARPTFADMDAAAARFGGWLHERGARRVALLATNQWRWHAAACGVFRAGAVLVPLDPKLPPEEHTALLAHSGADVLVAEHHLARALAFDGPAAVIGGAGDAAFDACAGTLPAPFVPRTRDDDACIVYSSGTGGRAKGCVLSHGAYLAQCDALVRRQRFRPGDRYLSILPANHAIDFMVGFLGPYWCGATVVHLRTLRPEFVRDAFPRYRIAYMALVPLVLENLRAGLEARLADAGPLARAAIALYRTLAGRRVRLGLARVLLRPLHRGFGGRLTALFVGGAFTEPDTLRFFHGLGVPVLNGYGLTEAGTVVTLNDADDLRPDTVGRPLPGTEVRLGDPDASGAGEVLVRGPTLMRRYLDDEALTAETIRDGWLHTGDVGVLDDGALKLLGRRKNMIVTAGGKNVYPEDVENAFAGLPVEEACVFAAHYVWPGRDERLVFVVRPRRGAEFRDELRRRNRRLAEFRRVSGVLVHDEPFPRTASLKVRRFELADALRARDPAEVEPL